MFHLKKLIFSRDDFFCVSEQTNSYFIVYSDKAICFDPGIHINGEILNELGIKSLEYVFLTSSDRSSCIGLNNICPIMIYAGEKTLENMTSGSPGRYNMVDFEPDKFLTASNINGIISLKDNHEIHWHDWVIKILATPGLSLDSEIGRAHV